MGLFTFQPRLLTSSVVFLHDRGTMAKFFIGLIVVIVIIGGGLFYFNTKQATAPAPSENIAIPPPPAPVARSITVELGAQNNSGETGTATMTEENGKTRVVLALEGVPDDILQPAHIHTGSCAKIGGVKYPLTNVSGVGDGRGGSETVVDVSLDSLTAMLPLAINVHQSSEKANVYVACGDIKTEGTSTGTDIEEGVIEFTSSGYTPSTLTIKAGTKVTFKNTVDTDTWPASAVHPTHKAYPGSDIQKCGTAEESKIFDACRNLKKGETFSFVFNEKGTWFYHNHLDTKYFGKIIVE